MYGSLQLPLCWRCRLHCAKLPNHFSSTLRLQHKPSDVSTKDGSVPAGTFELGQHHRGAQESSGSWLHERPLAAVTAEPAPQQVVGLAHTSSEEPLARVYSPRILASGIADTYSLRTFAHFDRWRDLSGDTKAYEVYRYLADTHTGLYHMNVVAEGDELAQSEFVEIRDPVKILNVYGYAYCGILALHDTVSARQLQRGPATVACQAGITWLPRRITTTSGIIWTCTLRAVFRRDDGRLASLEEARRGSFPVPRPGTLVLSQ